ncbi:hypothetical protein HYH03_012437 [Edaphochlamys debaryana]|uniref:Uncharacterized protein n=1 Tax=Edaphochlamys debaryana TaxID=47281 RepID=A0A836BVF6_9CHLO|nr:hypothetical protein HYH03_012437 [Edaphochlamys debaryana]|eukprot:KAG2488998.1 hypothetical protein HYH03_012437 [Edaphochlamys debaryana]
MAVRLLPARAARAACRRRSAPISASASPSAPSASASSPRAVAPDFSLACPHTGAAIHVFGVEHLTPQPHIGEWILRQRPSAVLVETAMGPEHGAAAGAVLRCGDRVADPTAAFYLRMFCQIGVTLQDFKEGDFTASPLWGQIQTGYNGEQLAYIGALAVGAPLVFADRPKAVTYQRLFAQCSAADFDAGYARAATANYRSFLGLPPAPYDPAALGATERVAMQEREAVMLGVAAQLCRNALPSAPLELGGAPASIALVAGSAHLPGLRHLWDSGLWRQLLSPGAAEADLAASPLLAAPAAPAAPESDPSYGLRRGLMAAMMKLSTTREVLADVERCLGPVPVAQQAVYDGVQEVYGSPRMQLACLPRDLLDRLVVGLPRGTSFEEVLAPLRAFRPSAGGPAYSEEMMMELRALNFELD